MKNKDKHTPDKNAGKEELPGYPLYPAKDDIYSHEKRQADINPDDNSKLKEEKTPKNGLNEKDYSNTLMGDDLDVPGAELDDADEEIGNEDEENNYYS